MTGSREDHVANLMLTLIDTIMTPLVNNSKSLKKDDIPGGVLEISSDRDDQRIFLGLKFSIPGFFGARKFGLGSLI